MGNPPELGPHCCHRNDVQTDNRVDNLYWGNGLTNSQDYHKNKNEKLYKEGKRQIKQEKELTKEERTAKRIANRIAQAEKYLSTRGQYNEEQT